MTNAQRGRSNWKMTGWWARWQVKGRRLLVHVAGSKTMGHLPTTHTDGPLSLTVTGVDELVIGVADCYIRSIITT